MGTLTLTPTLTLTLPLTLRRSYAMGTKSKGHAAKAIRAQFELQVENVKQALDAVTATLSDPNVLPCILGDQPERPSATRHV